MRFKKEIFSAVGFVLLLVLLFVFKGRLQVSEDLMPVTLEPETIKVYVYGEVQSPGVYEILYDDRLDQVIELAGGFTDIADKRVNLAMILEDGQMITIYPIKEEVTYNGLDLMNYGDFDMILEVNGVGEVLCRRIIEYREANGFYETYEDLLEVEGIGSSKLESIQIYLEIN